MYIIHYIYILVNKKQAKVACFSKLLGDRDSNPNSQDQNLKSYL